MRFSLDDKTFQQLQKSIGYVPTYTSQTESETTHPKQGLFGDFVDSVQMGAWKGASDLARGVNAVIDSDWLGKVSEWAGRKADENFQTMSPEMQKALSESAFDGFDGETGEGKGVLNYHWWAGNFGAFLGSNLDAVATLGVGKLATTAIKQGGKMLTKEAAEEIGEAAIKEATKRGIPERYKTAIGYSAVMGAMSAGSRDNQIRDELSAWNDDQFAESEQFRNDYYQLRESQDTQNLSDIEVFDLTKERFIDKAAKDAALDPVAMATDFSVGLFSGLGGGYKGILAPSQTVGKGVLKGMGIEGSTEALQGVAEQYALNDTAQQLYDHGRLLSENMGKAAAEGAVLGAAFGGVFGGIDGFGEKRRVANIQATKTGIPEIDASLEAHAEAMNQQLSSLTEALHKSHSPRKTMQEKMATFNQKYNQTTEPETLKGQQAVTSVQNLDINNNDIRHSFAGMNAKTADHSLLEQAKQAMENGVNPEEIRKQTGWFKGVDERWRLEINDRELSLNLDKFKQSENKGRVAQGYFSDLIKHDKLLSAYPDLESLYINIEISPNVMGDGRYSPRYQVDFGGGDLQWAAEEIIVKAKNYEEARKTLVHELQHAIQYRENFARGGTLSARNELIAANEQTIENLSDKVNYLKKQEIISPEDRAVIDEYHNAQKELEKLNNVSDELLYWNLAGEVEARLVSHRINLPDAGRRRIEPFIQESVPREQQVLRFHDGINHQLNEDFSSDFVKAIDVIAQGGTVATQIIDVGMTPNVLKMLGLPDANVIISSAVLHKVMLGKHNVTPETLKQLPKQINDPVAVMKSSTKDNGYVVLTELTESVNGVDKPIVAALHLKRSSLGLELINIASVYGRNNSQIQRGLENDLLYLNKEKGAKLSDNLTLQLRSPLSENSSISNDIKTETDLSQYQNQPKSQTFEFTAEKFHIANAVGKALSQHFEVMHSSELGIDDPAIEAAYNQKTGKIVIVANNIRANSILSREERLKWVAWHELAHRGLQVRFGKDFRALLGNVDKNKAVNQLATAIQAQRLDAKDNRALAVEEALAELHAAYTTGKLEELESRYNINISKLNKAGFRSWFEMTVENIRNLFAKLFGVERVKSFSHQELLELLTDIKRNAGGEINQQNGDIRYSRSAMEKLGLGKNDTLTDKVKSAIEQHKDKSVSEWKQLFTGIGRKANAAIFDALAPLKYAEDAAGIRDSNESAYVAARLAAGSASITEASMLHGLPEFDEHGFVQRKQGTSNKDSLVGIMESLGGDVNAFLGWVAGNRAEQLFAEGRERNLDMADITYLKSLNKGKEEKFELARAKLQAWNNAALDLAEQSGLISAKTRASFGDNSFYIPFYRENDEGDPISPYRKSGLANQNSGIRKLKGSDKATSELLGNLISNATKLIDASVKNMAMNKAVINLADTEVISVIENPNMMDYKGIDKFKGDSGKTLVYIGGEQYLIEIHDKAVFNALTSINQKPIDYIGHKALIGAKRLLTATVTTMPDFMLRNILRDMAQAWTVDKNGFKLGIDSVNGFKKALNKSDSAIDLMFTGATFGTGYIDAGDPNVAAKKIRQHLRKNGLSESEQEGYMRSVIWSKDQLSKALDKYLAVGNAAENANRIAVYENALKAGKSRAQAALEAKDLMDFSMRGNASIIRWMGDVLPFFNARMQGLSQLGRSLRDNPRKVALRGAYIASASVMLAAMNVGNEAYESLPDEEKDNYWHIFLGEQHFRIPKPFEIGVIFGSMPERLFRTMSGQDPSGVFADRVYSALLNTFALNPIPQLGKPISELYFNRNTFTGSQIETMADQRLLPEARYNENTSLTARELGLLTGNSPKKIEHLVRGYFGTLGMYVLGMSDTVLRTGGNYGDAPTKHWHEMPLLGVLYRGNVNIPPRYTSQAKYFYDYVSEVNQIAATIKEYQDDGRIQDAKTLQKENAALLRFKPTLDDASKQLRQLKAKIDLIMSSPSLTSEQKQRRIENLAEKRNALQRAVVERVNREDF